MFDFLFTKISARVGRFFAFIALTLILILAGCRSARAPMILETVHYVRDTVIHTRADTLRICERAPADTVRVENERIKVELVRDTVTHYLRGYAIAKPETVTVTKENVVYKVVNAPPLPEAPPAAWYETAFQYVTYGFAVIGVTATGFFLKNVFFPTEYRLAG